MKWPWQQCWRSSRQPWTCSTAASSCFSRVALGAAGGGVRGGWCQRASSPGSMSGWR